MQTDYTKEELEVAKEVMADSEYYNNWMFIDLEELESDDN